MLSRKLITDYTDALKKLDEKEEHGQLLPLLNDDHDNTVVGCEIEKANAAMDVASIKAMLDAE
jgi:hypothetical protein